MRPFENTQWRKVTKAKQLSEAGKARFYEAVADEDPCLLRHLRLWRSFKIDKEQKLIQNVQAAR